MPVVIAVAGFVGAWLLVAGPVYQAAVELDAEAGDRAAMARVNDAIPVPPMSPWWWLLPPVAFLRQHRATQKRHEAMLHEMTTDQVAQILRFGAKATGWLIVALGAAFIAVKETWELVELLEWSGTVFAVLLIGSLAIALLYAPLRMHRDHRMMKLKVDLTRPPGQRSS